MKYLMSLLPPVPRLPALALGVVYEEVSRDDTR